MSNQTSNLSVLGSSQNLIATHVPGCNPPTLKNSITVPNTITAAAPYFPNVTGAVYNIQALAVPATIVLPNPTLAKGYQMDFIFSGQQAAAIVGPPAIPTAALTFAPLLQNGTIGNATLATSLSCFAGHALTFAAGAVVSTVNTAAKGALFVAGEGANVLGPGDRITFTCDGTNWYVEAIAAAGAPAATAFAFTVAA